MHFRPLYFAIALLLLLVEIAIATIYSSVEVIRGSIGDILAVMLLYVLIRALYPVGSLRLALGVFGFAVALEAGQYFGLAERLGFARGSVGSILIGTTFSWADIVMYGVGCVAAPLLDAWFIAKRYSVDHGSSQGRTTGRKLS